MLQRFKNTAIAIPPALNCVEFEQKLVLISGEIVPYR